MKRGVSRLGGSLAGDMSDIILLMLLRAMNVQLNVAADVLVDTLASGATSLTPVPFSPSLAAHRVCAASLDAL